VDYCCVIILSTGQLCFWKTSNCRWRSMFRQELA